MSNLEYVILDGLNTHLQNNGVTVEAFINNDEEVFVTPAIVVNFYNDADGLRTASRTVYSTIYNLTVNVYTDGSGRVYKNLQLCNSVSDYFKSIGFRRTHKLSVPNLGERQITRYQLRFMGNVTLDGMSY